MIMDIFFDLVPRDLAKRRTHFHTFMLDVHDRIHQLKQKNPLMGDPIPQVARDIAQESTLLCFDEFQVTDVADALIWRRLFDELFKHGCIMVATSNRPPVDLYKSGLNRVHFLPFISFLIDRHVVHQMDNPTFSSSNDVIVDYRRHISA